jgi:hypothetical protein
MRDVGGAERPTIAYKLSDADGWTRRGLHGETQWIPGSEVTPLRGDDTSREPWAIIAHASPEVALVHEEIVDDTKRCHELEIVEGSWNYSEVMHWTQGRVRVLREVPLPVLSRNECAAWAIVLALHPCTRAWAVRWLSGLDRSVEAAEEADAMAFVEITKANVVLLRAEAARAHAFAAWTEGSSPKSWTSTKNLVLEARRRWERAYAAGYATSIARGTSPFRRMVYWSAEALFRAEWAALDDDDVSVASEKVTKRLPLALARARDILAGKFPAERFDEPFV